MVILLYTVPRSGAVQLTEGGLLVGRKTIKEAVKVRDHALVLLNDLCRVSAADSCIVYVTHLLECLATLPARWSRNKITICGGHQAEELEKRLLHGAGVCQDDLHKPIQGMPLLVIPSDLADSSQESWRDLSKMHRKVVSATYPKATECDGSVLVEGLGHFAVKEDSANLLEQPFSVRLHSLFLLHGNFADRPASIINDRVARLIMTNVSW